jgi:hypothetical protein
MPSIRNTRYILVQLFKLFALYLAQGLELTLPLLRFYFHDGVREACAM